MVKKELTSLMTHLGGKLGGHREMVTPLLRVTQRMSMPLVKMERSEGPQKFSLKLQMDEWLLMSTDMEIQG